MRSPQITQMKSERPGSLAGGRAGDPGPLPVLTFAYLCNLRIAL
jgi:hypothetical protein